MGESSIVDEILDFIPKVNFTTTKNSDETVSLFESTIRYLGGLVSSGSLKSLFWRQWVPNV